MAIGRKSRRAVTLTAGWICLASAGLNWWNMVGVGATFWRILLASAITLVGFCLLVRGFRAGKAGESRSSDVT